MISDAAVPPVIAHQVLFTTATPSAGPPTWTTVTVRPGDTLWDLAIAHRTTPQALVSKNRLPDHGRMIRPGQRLLVPGKAAAATKPSAPKAPTTATPSSGRAQVHVVRSGDTMSGIAVRYRVSLTKLLAANRLANPRLIQVGQRITIPHGTTTKPTAPKAPTSQKPTTPKAPTSQKPSTTTARVHVVVSGDTMSDIAASYRVSLGALLAANPGVSPGMIFVGQRISVPGTSGPAQPTTTPSADNTFAGHTYPDSVVNRAKANRDLLASRSVPNRTETAAMIRRIATSYGVDPKLALAIGWQESGWHQRAVSVANAIGTMQVIPSSGEWASDLVGRKLDLLDTEDNITAGVAIIRALMASADSRDQAIAGYYQGLHSVKTRGMYSDTKTYVKAVMAHYDRM